MRVQDSGIKAWGVGCGVWGVEFRVWGLGFRFLGVGCRVQGFGFVGCGACRLRGTCSEAPARRVWDSGLGFKSRV